MMSIYPWFLLSQAFQEMPRGPSFQGFRGLERDPFSQHGCGLYLVIVISPSFLRLPLSVLQERIICRERRLRHFVILLVLLCKGALISRVFSYTPLSRRTSGPYACMFPLSHTILCPTSSFSPTHLRPPPTCDLASLFAYSPRHAHIIAKRSSVT